MQKNKYISEPARQYKITYKKVTQSQIVDSPPNGWSDDNILNPDTQAMTTPI